MQVNSLPTELSGKHPPPQKKKTNNREVDPKKKKRKKKGKAKGSTGAKPGMRHCRVRGQCNKTEETAKNIK